MTKEKVKKQLEEWATILNLKVTTTGDVFGKTHLQEIKTQLAVVNYLLEMINARQD